MLGFAVLTPTYDPVVLFSVASVAINLAGQTRRSRIRHTEPRLIMCHTHRAGRARRTMPGFGTAWRPRAALSRMGKDRSSQ